MEPVFTFTTNAPPTRDELRDALYRLVGALGTQSPYYPRSMNVREAHEHARALLAREPERDAPPAA